MLLLLFVPVLVLVTYSHRYLQRYAPSNALIARARMGPPRWRSALILAFVVATTLVTMRLLAEAVVAGAPGWLNLVVLILAWDAIKFGLAAASVALSCAVASCRSPRRRGPGQRELDRSRVALG